MLQQLPRSTDGGQGSGQLPTTDAILAFRFGTRGRLLWVSQMRELAAAVEGGPCLFREAYERQMLIDPENLTRADGSWVPAPAAAWTQPAPEQLLAQAQAFLSPLAVLRYDGRAAVVSVDRSKTTVQQAVDAAADRLGEPSFDPTKHTLYCVGAPPKSVVLVGHYVKFTGLVSGEEMNGKIGIVTAAEGDYFNVTFDTGTFKAHRDNVVFYNASAVMRQSAFEVLPGALLGDWCLSDGARILWLERQTPSLKISDDSLSGPLKAIKSQLTFLAARGSGSVSIGELRSFLWNLHLQDEDFVKVQERFAPQSVYLEMDDVMFLIGRSHVQYPGVPVDALIYEAVVSILGRRTTAHIDRDLGGEDEGLGYGNACRLHCASYTTSLILQGTVVFCLIALLLSWLFEVQILHMSPDTESGLLATTGVAYFIYLCHLACCVRLTRAFANLTEGMEAVMALMDQPRSENPQFHWTSEAYHYITRVEHYTDSEGKSRTRTRQERVVTHRASASGIIPSTDLTPGFVPNTRAQQTQIDTELQLDFSSSNYLSEYSRWCSFHRWDIHQDCHRSEDCASRASSCLAVWTRRPWWMNGCSYWLANIFLLSFFYRIWLQAQMARQKYIYVKRCYSIPSQSPLTGAGFAAVGASLAVAAALGGGAGGLATAAMVGVGVALDAAAAKDARSRNQQLEWQRIEQERLQFQQQELQRAELDLREKQMRLEQQQLEQERERRDREVQRERLEREQRLSWGKGARDFYDGKGKGAAWDVESGGKGAADNYGGKGMGVAWAQEPSGKGVKGAQDLGGKGKGKDW